MKSEYLLQKNYKDNIKLRTSFNELAKKVYQLNFEDWYQNGYWGENYNPYSIIVDEKVVANVSVNTIDFNCNGRTKHYIQLGTVMTDEAYQNQGLSRTLMEAIIKEYQDQSDGIFLFANDNVLEFYPKFGFKRSKQYQYSKVVQNVHIMSVIRVPMENKLDWKILENAIRSSICNGSFEMANNPGLIMFYVTKFMRNCVYYVKNQDAYVIAEIEKGKLLIYNIFSKNVVDLYCIIEGFGCDIKETTFGFTPLNTEGYILSELCEKNTTLFVKGKELDGFENKGMMFPTLSHA